MRQFVLAVAALALISIRVTGQSDEELVRLRARLNLPSSTAIVSSSSTKLPARETLRVYVATGKDGQANGRLTKWIDKWNQNDGQRYGKLQAVSDLSQADVIVARDVVRGDTSVQRRSAVGIWSKRDPLADRTATKPGIDTRPYIYRPRYSYLIVRTPETLAIVYRLGDKGHPEDNTDADGNLIREFEHKLKRR
ncbi:MAG TPA: hypothetical protein VF656_03760 [Pyrinomonadaceae bacterium]|jgi:hypothetical protein